MVEITKNLYVGDDNDFKTIDDGWYIIHACKEPYHRRLLGYTTRSCPMCSEYYYAERDNILYLNLVDAKTVQYIPKIVINKAIDFIENNINEHKILLHCNKGESRSPSIALLYLNKIGVIHENNPLVGIDEFRKIYPNYKPNPGMFQYVLQNWR